MEITGPSDRLFESLMEAVAAAYRIMAIEPVRAQVKTLPFTRVVQKTIVDAGLPWKPNVPFVGESGYQHKFAFEVQSPNRGSTLLQVSASSGAKAAFESYAFALLDIANAHNGVPVSMVTQRDTLSEDQRRLIEHKQGSVVGINGLLDIVNTPYEQALPAPQGEFQLRE
jgi:hypothetical protein